jgi:nitrate/nitrite transporter NarK
LNFKEISKLPLAFWLILLISMLAEALFIPFLDNGNAYYSAVFNLEKEDAGVYLILPYCVSSLFVIILGFAVDRIKKRSYVLIASCFFFTFTYLFMMFTEASEAMRNNEFVRWMPSFLLGICIAIFCAIIVPTVPMLISPKLLGTGFGLMEMLQNLALGVFPLVGGALQESEESEAKGFHLQTSFFFIVSCLCVGVSIVLKGIDLTSGNRLDVKDFRKQYLAKILKEDVGEE